MMEKKTFIVSEQCANFELRIHFVNGQLAIECTKHNTNLNKVVVPLIYFGSIKFGLAYGYMIYLCDMCTCRYRYRYFTYFNTHTCA